MDKVQGLGALWDLGPAGLVACCFLFSLELPLYPQTLRDEHGSPLRALLTTGQSALTARTNAELTRTATRLATEDWKSDAGAVRLAVYGALLDLAARQGGGKAWAETFFASDESATADPGAAEPVRPMPPPTPEPEPAEPDPAPLPG